jgi:hypothetical protein
MTSSLTSACFVFLTVTSSHVTGQSTSVSQACSNYQPPPACPNGYQTVTNLIKNGTQLYCGVLSKLMGASLCPYYYDCCVDNQECWFQCGAQTYQSCMTKFTQCANNAYSGLPFWTKFSCFIQQLYFAVITLDEKIFCDIYNSTQRLSCTCVPSINLGFTITFP